MKEYPSSWGRSGNVASQCRQRTSEGRAFLNADKKSKGRAPRRKAGNVVPLVDAADANDVVLVGRVVERAPVGAVVPNRRDHDDAIGRDLKHPGKARQGGSVDVVWAPKGGRFVMPLYVISSTLARQGGSVTVVWAPKGGGQIRDAVVRDLKHPGKAGWKCGSCHCMSRVEA
eukprot:354836-Chlamydomonas_euryale.AAC.2